MKKTASTAIAMLVAVTLCFPASAFAPQKIKSLSPDFSARLTEANLDGKAVGREELDKLETHPGSELEIVLADDGDGLFFDQSGAPVNTADVTVSKMRAASVAATTDSSSGGEFIKAVGLNVKNAGTPLSKPVLLVTFEAEYDSVYPADFDVELVITIGGETQESSRTRISGTFGYPETTVGANDKSVVSVETVLVAEEYIPLISVDAGGGVTAEVSMEAGGRYMLSASYGGGDTPLMQENPHIVYVINITASGFETEQIKNIYISGGESLYAYDENGAFLGMTGGKLPFFEKYYLADERVVF